MALRFFVIPTHDSSAFEEELNGFLVRHKVVSIERHLIDQGVNSFWAICVDYLSPASKETAANANLSRSRVDYKTVLPPEEFAVFSRLRDLRKEMIQKGSNRVNRGGSWANDAANCRTANRNTNAPTNRTTNNGFRLALNSAGIAALAPRLQTEQIIFQSDRVSA